MLTICGYSSGLYRGSSNSKYKLSLLLDLPSAPLNVKLVKSTPDSIRISWTAPQKPGVSRITDYYMELFHPNNTVTTTNYTVLSVNPILDHTFTKLFANLEYGIRVSAYNAIGRGEQSALAKFKTVFYDSSKLTVYNPAFLISSYFA